MQYRYTPLRPPDKGLKVWGSFSPNATDFGHDTGTLVFEGQIIVIYYTFTNLLRVAKHFFKKICKIFKHIFIFARLLKTRLAKIASYDEQTIPMIFYYKKTHYYLSFINNQN